MDIIQCPKCHKNIRIDITKALDEEAEIYRCKYCNYIFRYAPDWEKYTFINKSSKE